MTTTTVQVSEKPILFSGPMVRAILSGVKTQTRRVIKPQPERDPFPCHWVRSGWSLSDPREYGVACTCNEIKCPYVAERLWVRETFYAYGRFRETGSLTESGKPEIEFEDFTLTAGFGTCYLYHADAVIKTESNKFSTGWHKRPSIFIPRVASRITLQIANVRVERLQEITGRDVLAEGVDNGASNPSMGQRWENMQRMAWEEGWNKINEKRGYSWESNPWVWVITFRRVA